jgi:hypothetical protein
VTNLEDILARIVQELGPDASDEDVKAKLLDRLEALPEGDKREVLEEMVQLASTAQLAHLREVGEAVKDQETPGRPD